jgi:hypothetical protein
MQSDPIGLMAGVDTYSYVESGPLVAIDPEGLAPKPIRAYANALMTNLRNVPSNAPLSQYASARFMSPLNGSVCVFAALVR